MNENRFKALLSNKVEQILAILHEEYGMGMMDARIYLYSSKVYATLEDEESKAWTYSAFQLVELLQEEKETGEAPW